MTQQTFEKNLNFLISGSKNLIIFLYFNRPTKIKYTLTKMSRCLYRFKKRRISMIHFYFNKNKTLLFFIQRYTNLKKNNLSKTNKLFSYFV